MGGPSPLWGQTSPLFHTQNYTRTRRTDTSPPMCPQIGAIGGIVAGVVIIVVIAIVALLVYKLRRLRISSPLSAE